MLRIKGHLVWRGMKIADAASALLLSGKWEYVASFGTSYWFRNRKWGDVVEVTHNSDGTVVDVDVL